jgi:hypothetical protein
VNNKFERMWKEAVVGQFDILARHFPTAEEYYRNSQSGLLVSGLGFELRTSEYKA